MRFFRGVWGIILFLCNFLTCWSSSKSETISYSEQTVKSFHISKYFSFSATSWVVGISPPVALEVVTWKLYVHQILPGCELNYLSAKPLRGFRMFKTACYMTAGKLEYVISSFLSTGAFANTIVCQTDKEICLDVGVSQVFGSSGAQYFPHQMVAISKTPCRYIYLICCWGFLSFFAVSHAVNHI